MTKCLLPDCEAEIPENEIGEWADAFCCPFHASTYREMQKRLKREHFQQLYHKVVTSVQQVTEYGRSVFYIGTHPDCAEYLTQAKFDVTVAPGWNWTVPMFPIQPQRYDTVVSIYHVNQFQTEDDLQQFFKNVSRYLSPQGVLILVAVNPTSTGVLLSWLTGQPDEQLRQPYYSFDQLTLAAFPQFPIIRVVYAQLLANYNVPPPITKALTQLVSRYGFDDSERDKDTMIMFLRSQPQQRKRK